MRILVQFAADSGELAPIVEIDHTSWASLPTHPLAAVCCQGVWLAGYDHWHWADDEGTAVFTGWSDDPTQWDGNRWGQVWRFPPLASDPSKGGRLNTRISRQDYMESESRPDSAASYSELPQPLTNIRTGLYLSDANWAAHVANRPQVRWQDWAD